MKKLLLILLCLPMIGFGQNVNIPDANFKAYLVGNTAINTNGDAEIQVSEATVFNGQIYCSNLNISDLTGIEAFTALTYLNCGQNQLTSIDVSNNTMLTFLETGDNQLTSLDISNNTALNGLDEYNNQLTSLDVSNNTALSFLNCSHNQITYLDVSNNIALNELHCQDNQLTCIDVSNNTVLNELRCYWNPLLEQLNTKNGNSQNMFVMAFDDYSSITTNLLCVEVDDIAFATNNWMFGSFTSITNNCNYANPCNSSTSIQEHTTNKELLKITDLLGRETKQENQPLFYLYDDGTVEKRIVIE